MLDASEFLSATISTEPPKEPYIKVAGEIDYRLKQLSYSSSNLLHNCARKYQLYKLGTDATKESTFESITFEYGHAVGLGTQLIFQDRFELKDIFWQVFTQYPLDIFLEDEKAKKGFFSALACLSKLFYARKSGFLADWTILEWEGKPAIEFSFCINLPNGFRYRGFVDAVLINKKDGRIGVLERKTTKNKTEAPEKYKNSAQAIGYSIVLDHLFPTLSAYEVIYLCYSSTSMEETVFEFGKSFLQRAHWIQDIIFDCEAIAKYDEAEFYPQRGESCYDYYRPCQYFQTCSLDISHIAKKFDPETDADTFDYQITVTMNDLIESQLRRTV
jgi:hypothetical protein